MTTIAVTGATGHLGGLIVDQLLEAGVSAAEIVPLVRSQKKARPFADKGTDVRIGSFDDPIQLAATLHGVDKIVLISPPTMDNAIRLQQLYQAVLAIQAIEVSQLVYVSLAHPELRAFGLEDVDMAIEHSIQAMGIPFTILRNGVYLDELIPELRAALSTGTLVSTTDDQPLNWVSRKLLATAITAGLLNDEHLSKTYELTASALFTYADLARLLGEAMGQDISLRNTSRADAIETLEQGGMTVEDATTMIDAFHAPIAARKFTTTSTAITELTGHDARLTVATIRQLLN